MSPHSFLLVLTGASAVIALWLVVRFPKVGPATPFRALANLMAAYLGGMLVVSPLMDGLRQLPFPGSVVLTVVGGGLPPLVYLFVSVAWLLRSIQGLLAPRS